MGVAFRKAVHFAAVVELLGKQKAHLLPPFQVVEVRPQKAPKAPFVFAGALHRPIRKRDMKMPVSLVALGIGRMHSQRIGQPLGGKYPLAISLGHRKLLFRRQLVKRLNDHVMHYLGVLCSRPVDQLQLLKSVSDFFPCETDIAFKRQ